MAEEVIVVWASEVYNSTPTALESSMEVLRWVLFFMLALLLIVYGIFWLVGRSMPLPQF